MNIAQRFDGSLERRSLALLAGTGLVVLALLALLLRGGPPPAGGVDAGEVKTRAADAYGQLPLRFEQNRGQSDPRVRFLSRGPGYTLFLTEREAVLSLTQAKPSSPGGAGSSAPRGAVKERSAAAVLRMRPVGASPHAKLTAGERLPGVSNYLRGRDPRGWQSGVPGYGRVRYQAVYPGIDLVYHGSQGKLEYDFVVAPGADPGRIGLSLTGAKGLSIDARGDLVLPTAAGKLRQQRPFIYQQLGAQRRQVPGRYVLTAKDRVAFEVGAYDRSRPLVIDPVLAYSSYLGGSGSDPSSAIAVDSSGSAYVTGQTNSANFPTASPRQGANAGNSDVFVTKLNPSGSSLVYSTYLGGTSADVGQGIAVDSSGSAYVTGYTYSTTSFPTGAPSGGVPFQPVSAGTNADAFFTKLSPSGSSLVYSTYLGGTANDVGAGIAVDSSGSAYLTGYTLSTNFPPASPVQPANGGGYDAFVAKINPSGAPTSDLVYSSYLGGTLNDYGFGIAVDSSRSAYLTGSTGSTNFPTASPLQPASGGSDDAFATKLTPAGSSLAYSTYLGGASGDGGRGIAVDSSDSAYLTGYTGSTNFPTASPVQPASGGNNDAFVTKLNPSGSDRAYSTYVGGSGSDVGQGIAVDASRNAYLTGYTGSPNFPTASAMQGASADSNDAFVTKLNPSGSSRVYSSYLGGSSSDQGSGIALDSSANAYLTGSTSSTNFPMATPAQPASGGGQDAFVTKLRPGTDLSLSMTDAPDPVVAGQRMTYTLSARNGGPELAQAVSLRDTLPTGVSYVSGSPGCSPSGQVVTCSVGDLAKDASAEREITVSVPVSAANSSVVNTATVQSSTFDPVSANDSATATTAVLAPPAPGTSANLAISKSASPDPARIDQPLTYTLSTSNAGPDTAVGVMLRDELPAGVTFVSASDGCATDLAKRVVTCSVGNMGGNTTLSRQIVVKPTLPDPSLRNAATVSSSTADPASADNTSTATTNVRAFADVSVTKTDSPDPSASGQLLTYTLTARNAGPDGASGVVLQDQLPGGVELVSAEGCSRAAGVITCVVGDLANGVSASRQIVVRPTEANPALSNTASVQTSVIDENIANDSTRTTTVVREAPPLPEGSTALEGTAAPAPVSATSPLLAVPPGAGVAVDLGFGSELARTIALKSCLATVAGHQKREQRLAERGPARRRAGARRHLSRHAASGRRACLRLHGRTPGPVSGVSARALSATKVALSFLAPGSDGSRPPAARSYLIKQSRATVASARGFARARSLCKGACGFSVTQVGTRLTLTVGGLRAHTSYQWAVAARDNVSGQLGPRSQSVQARTR